VRIALPPDLDRVLAETPALQRAYLVGGCVRDALLGLPVKDFDVEVFGVDYDELVAALLCWGRTDLVGRSFGVVKLTTAPGCTFDFTLPRRDSKVSAGHRGFEIIADPALPPSEAAARRDFTINALLYDPRRGEVLDFFNGQEDLRNHRLRHTTTAFVEDPLRVLRGMQFAGRFDLTAAPETVALCRSICGQHGELAIERVREEWFKWAGLSRVPSRGLRFLVETGWDEHYPEVRALVGTPQDPEWHPEGDVFTHTAHACDALARLPGWRAADETSRIVYMLAVLAHDFAKPATTHAEMKNGRMRIVSPGHEAAGGPLAAQFLHRLNAPNAVRERVVPLVQSHLAHLQAITDRGVRRLARRLQPETIAGLCLVITADQFGRPPKPAEPSEGLLALEAKAAELQLQSAAPRPILMGRHLLELGMSPGPAIGSAVALAFEAQLEGDFADLAGALRWLAANAAQGFPADVRNALDAKIAAQGRMDCDAPKPGP
jgi:tRNA nucleotidyltransferase (CCA-adding enzyme)